VAGLHDPVRLGGRREREHAADHRPQPAIGKQRGERPGAVAVILDEHAVKRNVGVQHRV
jgi:hypothetical protein